ncbi:RluA family pseudouridine synthase [Stigmatella aurantiaca]|uniref:Pseudouridine synthase n=1 Tax=Stigmatella aurantiaca (strain DW4/3-1) TaxID=378806 RepID=Q09CL4_STIAD|nr:RluA family pseudouridine synthase [Stigmatella aurantiaca]ADO70026.1 Pseudouridine synthase, RluA family [Stigmatella aurantiaca DW4/3-1]EAU69491.1 ribosomal large subunit pseudouridine synthase D [Stigmatella aurantiaca DW4/3-1]
MKRRTFHAEGVLVGRPVVEAVAAQLDVAVEHALQLVEAGAVYVGGRRCREGGLRLRAGQVVAVVLEEGGRSPLEALAPPPALGVLFEDEALIAVDKPVGITAQPTEGRAGGSLVDLVSERLGQLAGLVHRLDRETSGVTVFGKTPQATTALAAEFREGRARKRYVAATGPGLPASGTVDLPLSRDPARPGRWRASRAANGVPALTDFRTLYSGADFCLVELLPQTGRTHQLRAHLTALGAPILGDSRYGGAATAGGLSAGRCLLHAQGLELAHPLTGAALRIEAPLPGDLRCFFTAAEVQAPEGPLPVLRPRTESPRPPPSPGR